MEDSAPEVDRDGGGGVPAVSDSPQQRLKWIAHLEFAQKSDQKSAKNETSGTSWTDAPTAEDGITRTKKLR